MACCGQIIQDVKGLLSSNEAWTLSYSPRESNKAAHMLAKKALSDNAEVVWIEDIPSFIHQCILFEKYCMDIT